MMNKVSSICKSMLKMNRFKGISLSVGMALGSAAVLYAVYPVFLVASMIFMVVSHELGHFFEAIKHTSAAVPIFIPMGILVMGLTVIMPVTDNSIMKKIYEAGPRWGIFAGSILLVLSIISGSVPFIISSFSLACCELYSITLGSDARKIQSLQA